MALKPLGVGVKMPKPPTPKGLKTPTAPKAPTAPKMPGLVAKPKVAKPTMLAKRDVPQMMQHKPKTKKRIAQQKRAQAAISLTGGTLGLTALATRGRAAQLSRRAASLPKEAAVLTARSNRLKDRSTALTTTGAGVGGVGAFNFASYTNAEGKKDIKKGMTMEPFYGEPDPFEVSKAIPAVSNFKIGLKNPGGLGGQAKLSTRAGRAGQLLGRRSAERSESGGSIPGLKRKPKKLKPVKSKQVAEARARKNPQMNDDTQVLPVIQAPIKREPSFSDIRRAKRRTRAAAAGLAGTGAVGFYAGTHYEPRNR